MTNANTVKNKLIQLPVAVTEQDLKLLSAVLNASLTELTADRITPDVLARVTRSAGAAAPIVPVIVDFTTQILQEQHSEVYMTGQAKLLTQPEYHDIDKAQEVLSSLDEDVISNLPAALKSNSKTQVLVGPENVAKELRDASVVVTKFDIGDGMQGMIGVVGPTRMDYAKITARLSYFAENLSRMFSKSQLPPLKEAAEADVPEAPEPVPPEE
jgi:heat-inducible transcriptional repressor